MKVKQELTDNQLHILYQYLLDLLATKIKNIDEFAYSSANKNICLFALNMNRRIKGDIDYSKYVNIYNKALKKLELDKYFIAKIREDSFSNELIISILDNIDIMPLYVLAKLS